MELDGHGAQAAGAGQVGWPPLRLPLKGPDLPTPGRLLVPGPGAGSGIGMADRACSLHVRELPSSNDGCTLCVSCRASGTYPHLCCPALGSSERDSTRLTTSGGPLPPAARLWSLEGQRTKAASISPPPPRPRSRTAHAQDEFGLATTTSPSAAARSARRASTSPTTASSR